MRQRETSRRGRRSSAAFVELFILVGGPVLFHFLLPLTQVVEGWWRLSGLLLMIAGLLLANAGNKEFRRAETGFQLQDGAKALVISGPFRFSRNPIYLGMLIWMAGLAVLLGSLVSFIFPVLFFLMANFLLIPPEERKLKENFGGEFDSYCSQVRRWI